MASLAETLGLVVIDAMASGIAAGGAEVWYAEVGGRGGEEEPS